MPEIERAKLSAKLDTIPEHDREPYLRALKAKGYTWKSNLSEDATEEPGLGREAAMFLSKEGPPIGGAMVGAAMGAVAGPPGMIAGAMLGGAAGKAYGKIMEYIVGQTDPNKDTASGNAYEIGMSGLANALAEGTGQVAGKVASMSRPFLEKVGAQIIKAVSGVPEKYGQAVLSKPEILKTALDSKAMKQSYEAFERYTGLRGLSDRMWQEGKSISPGELEQMVLGTAKKIESYSSPGMMLKHSNPQEIYEASQAASHLKLAAKYGEPGAARAIESGNISKAKSILDKALEEFYPEYKNLRTANFYSKAKEAFSAILPQNKNLSPNVLRTSAALGGAGYEAAKGNYGRAALIMGAVSPAVTGAVIRSASAAAPALEEAAMVGTRVAAQSLSEKLDTP